jgi:hypothetical protein
MEPAMINKTLEAAKLIQRNSKYGTPEGLLLAHVSWEGLKNRIIVCGLAQQGWQVKTFKQAIDGQKYWKAENYRRSFRSIFGSDPDQTTGISQVWQQGLNSEKIRNKFVHGMGQANPKVMQQVFEQLTTNIEDTSWTKWLFVRRPNEEKIPLGDINLPIRAARNIQPDQSISRLRIQLGLKP